MEPSGQVSYGRTNKSPLHFPGVIAFLTLVLMHIKKYLKLSDMIQKFYLEVSKLRPDTEVSCVTLAIVLKYSISL